MDKFDLFLRWWALGLGLSALLGIISQAAGWYNYAWMSLYAFLAIGLGALVVFFGLLILGEVIKPTVDAIREWNDERKIRNHTIKIKS